MPMRQLPTTCQEPMAGWIGDYGSRPRRRRGYGGEGAVRRGRRISRFGSALSMIDSTDERRARALCRDHNRRRFDGYETRALEDFINRNWLDWVGEIKAIRKSDEAAQVGTYDTRTEVKVEKAQYNRLLAVVNFYAA